MFLLNLGKRDVAFPSLCAVFASGQFGEMNFVTALGDANCSGKRRSPGCSELPRGTLNPRQRGAGRRRMGGLSPGAGKPGPRGGFGQDPQVWRCLWVGVGVRNNVQGFHAWNLG